MGQAKITSTTETDSGWSFTVELEGRNYSVAVNEDYWRQLTGGEVSPERLVEASFDFILEREPASSILSEFDLAIINTYFPEYEMEIKEQLK